MTWLDAVAATPAVEAEARVRPGTAIRGHVVLLGLVLLAAVVYGLNLTVSGWANVYYSAAAQAASQSWAAWFFGSFDAANFITVDKPPVALWLMGLSVRIFGLSSFAILLPEALAGVATVAVLFVTVRRTFGLAAATIAGLVMALTPAAVLMFRYNNPDAVLTLLLVTAAWALSRGLDSGRLRWPMLAAALVGVAFLTKYLQAYLVLPVFALVWLVAAPGSLRRRLVGLALAGLTVIVSSGWWVAIVELIPSAGRPFVGGSETNSVVELIFGYDGLGRLFGMAGPGAAGGPGGGGGGFGGEPGLLRMFNDQFGGQIAWLLPASLVALVVGLVARARAPRTDAMRAGYLLWGGWLGVHLIVFSLMSGIIHPYYAVALAPAIAALVGAGAVELWRRLQDARPAGVTLVAGVVLALAIAGTGLVSWLLLGRTPDFVPWLRPLVIGGASIAAAAVVVLAVAPRRAVGSRPRLALGAAALALAFGAALAGPAAYAADTMGTALAGGDPAAGPAVASATGGRGFDGGAGPVGGGAPLPPGGGPAGSAIGPGAGGSGFAGSPAAGGGGPDGATVDADLVSYLVANQGEARWIVAVAGSNQAGLIQLATGRPVMAMGGFMGSDPAPTLAELRAAVASGALRFVILGGGGGGFGPGGGAATSDRDAWVSAECSPIQIGGSTVYDCAGAG